MRIRGGDCDDDVLSLTFSCYFFTTLTAIYAVEYVHVVSPHDAAHVDLGPSHWFPRADSNNVEMKVSASDLHVNCADLITPIRGQLFCRSQHFAFKRLIIFHTVPKFPGNDDKR